MDYDNKYPIEQPIDYSNKAPLAYRPPPRTKPTVRQTPRQPIKPTPEEITVEQTMDPEVQPSAYYNFQQRFKEEEARRAEDSVPETWFDKIRNTREFFLIGGILAYILLK